MDISGSSKSIRLSTRTEVSNKVRAFNSFGKEINPFIFSKTMVAQDENVDSSLLPSNVSTEKECCELSTTENIICCGKDSPQITDVLKQTQIHLTVDQQSVGEQIFTLLLEDWMFEYGSLHQTDEYKLLHDIVMKLVAESKPIKFMLPGFPVKCPNTDQKVLGRKPDLAEFLAIRTLQRTLRKIEGFYEPGVDFIIMSDYHTFDEYIGVTEEDYYQYHDCLKELIDEAGCADIIQVISLADFPEFKNVPSKKISRKLYDDYGGQHARDTFDQRLKQNQKMLETYKKLTKFMTLDQSKALENSPTSSPPRSPDLPIKNNSMFNMDTGDALVASSQSLSPPSSPETSPSGSPRTPRSKGARRRIKNVVRGMMVQGVALDCFLKQQNTVTNYIRLSIHHHPPKSGKFSVDLFKGKNKADGVLRTAWHHSVVFDSLTCTFTVAHRYVIESEKNPNSCLISVTYKGQDWFYLRVYFQDGFCEQNNIQASIKATMIRGQCGLELEVMRDCNKTSVSTDCIKDVCLTSLIKEFGVVVFRGFQKYDTEEHMLDSYAQRAPNGFFQWSFGALKKVVPDVEEPGFVHSKFYLPMHFDLCLPAPYMGCDQSLYQYEDYVPREFVLYCKKPPTQNEGSGNGATTFIDAIGAVLSLHGRKAQDWKSTRIVYETELKSKGEKAVYFGGKDNCYEYALISKCPWTGYDVLRWNESLSHDQNPDSDQQLWLKIKESPFLSEISPKNLEEEIKQLSMKRSTYFEHVYQEDDQVYVNNYTTLHGRQSFSASDRELWRIQALPPSSNIPKALKGELLMQDIFNGF